MNNINTIQYYNLNAKEFVDQTVGVDFASTQKRFTDKLLNGASVLDFGCGSGRDTKHFLEMGYQVDAIDGSVELCKLASDFTGVNVKHMYFEELSEVERYDAIWACASILHLPTEALKGVMEKMITSLRNEGIIYTSFKYGDYEGERNGRYFIGMTEEKFAKFIKEFDCIEIEEQWITLDVRPEKGEEKWLNLILRKK